MMQTKQCNGCKEIKTIDQFHIDSSKGDGRNTRCKVCVRARNQEWRDANPEKLKTSLKKSRKKIYKTVKEKLEDGTLVIPEKITCAICKEEKPSGEFFKSASNSTGRSSYCKPCHKNKSRSAVVKSQYNLSEEEYKELKKRSGGKCEICKKEPVRALDIDHCRKSGKVRGLLCNRCNMGLGQFMDSVENMQLAIEYLKKYGI